MSLELLIDEDTLSKVLVKMLFEAGHNVQTVNEVGLSGEPDPIVLDYARKNQRILVTRNCQDFEDLHLENSEHPGIFAIYENQDHSKDMSRQEIVKAIANIEAASIHGGQSLYCS